MRRSTVLKVTLQLVFPAGSYCSIHSSLGNLNWVKHTCCQQTLQLILLLLAIKKKRFYKIDAGSSEGMTEMIELEKKLKIEIFWSVLKITFLINLIQGLQWQHNGFIIVRSKVQVQPRLLVLREKKLQISNLKIKFN